MSHLLGGLFKYLAAAAIFIFSLSLSYTYFSSIAPRGMPWFTWAALGLTEIGFVCWLAVFMLQKHHDAHKTIAFVMIFVCVAALLFTDAVELSRLFGTSFFLTQFYYYGLIVLLLAHFLAFTLDFFVSYFEKYSFSGGGRKVSDEHYANLIRTSQTGRVRVRPFLAKPQPKEMALSQTAQIEAPKLKETMKEAGDTLKSGVNSATKKAKDFMKRGKQGVHAPGDEKMNTSRNTSTAENSDSDAN